MWSGPTDCKYYLRIKPSIGGLVTRKRWALAIAVIAGLILTAVSGSARQREAWEYTVQHTDSLGTLNKFGAEGWEAVTVYSPTPNTVRVLMKRRKS